MSSTRKKVIEVICNYRDESIGFNRWNYKAEPAVCQLVKTFDDELIDDAKKMGDIGNHSIVMIYFANFALYVAATSRDFEALSDDEIEAYKSLMCDVKGLYTEYLKSGLSTKLYFKIHCVHELVKLSAIYREDYDCKYRQSMLTSNYRDMCNIVHSIISNWDSLYESDFYEDYNNFVTEWEKSREKEKWDSTKILKDLVEKYKNN